MVKRSWCSPGRIRSSRKAGQCPAAAYKSVGGAKVRDKNEAHPTCAMVGLDTRSSATYTPAPTYKTQANGMQMVRQLSIVDTRRPD